MNFSHDASGQSSGQPSGQPFGQPFGAESPQSGAVPSPLSFDRFCNDDPDVLTLVVIGGRSHVQFHLLRLHTLGVVEAGAWSKLVPLPNCPRQGDELGESGNAIEGKEKKGRTKNEERKKAEGRPKRAA